MKPSITNMLTKYQLGTLCENDLHKVESLLLTSEPALNEYFLIKRTVEGVDSLLQPSPAVNKAIKKAVSSAVFAEDNTENLSANIWQKLTSTQVSMPRLTFSIAAFALVLFMASFLFDENETVDPEQVSHLEIDSSNDVSVSLNIL